MKHCRVIFVSKPLSQPKKFEAYLRKVTHASSWTYVGRVPSQEAAASRRLTPRQYEVLRELTLGKGVKEIARFLGISPKTVETHRSNLMHRLGMNRLPDLIRFAIKSGVLPITWIFEDEPRPKGP
jgi:DNA-binding NarL/FixJ family response regulator